MAKKTEAAHAPVEELQNIYSDLSKLDLTSVSRLTGEDRKEFSNQLDMLKERIKMVEEKFNEFI